MDFDQESEEIKRLIEQSRNSDGDEDYKRRVRMGGDLLSLLNNPSAAEINSGVKLAKTDYQGQAENVIKGMENPLEKAAKLSSIVKSYRDAENDNPAAKAELFRLQEKIRSSNDTAMESLKHKNAMELLAKKAESGLREVVDPVTGETSVVSTKAPKEASQSQYAAAGFGKRTQEADKVFSDLEKGGYNRGATIGGRMGDILTSGWVPFGSEAVSTERQLQDQAERDFVNAVLRRESGSAIAPTEFSSAELQYFPRPGDSEEVKRRKARNRQIVISNLLAEGRPALGRLDENLAAHEGNVKSAPNKAQFDQDKIAEELKKRGL